MLRVNISRISLEFEQSDKVLLNEILRKYEPVKRGDRVLVHGTPETLYKLLYEVSLVYDIELI